MKRISHYRSWIILAAGLGVFGVLALWNISSASIWFDEAFSAYIAQFNLADIARLTATDVHPPLYYWLLHGWQSIFGATDVGLRSMSVLFGAVAIVFAYLLALRRFGQRAAVLTLLFLVISPLLLRYSQEARMYTLAAAIVLAATYVLSYAVESKKRWLWVVYGVLVALGMWTHYFTALAWIAHWIWRAVITRQQGARGKQFWQKYLSRPWVLAHLLAVGLFLPWLPVAAMQLRTVQAYGFWIGPISVDSPVNFFTNLFYYLEHNEVQSWLVVPLTVVLITLAVLAGRTYRLLGRRDKPKYLLLAALAFAPVIVLLILSLPPLRSSYVERYLLPAVLGFALFAAVTLAVGLRRVRPVWTAVAALLVVGMMVFGVTNVYRLGNYNKNGSAQTLTKELVAAVTAQAKPGEPIVANSPWIFYEAVFYRSAGHPVYFIDANTQYVYGSLDMLKYDDRYKIKDLTAFTNQAQVIWYIGVTEGNEVAPFDPSWQRGPTITVQSPIDGTTFYKATQYRVAGTLE